MRRRLKKKTSECQQCLFVASIPSTARLCYAEHASHVATTILRVTSDYVGVRACLVAPQLSSQSIVWHLHQLNQVQAQFDVVFFFLGCSLITFAA